ncbi:MAG: hypothetical protein ACRCUI_10355, partial [Polymorphobacter sp.]
ARKYRRTGLGTAAATALFDRWPGVWRADVRRRNSGAAAFWHRTIAQHPRVSGLVVDDRDDADWDGPVFRFSIAAA